MGGWVAGWLCVWAGLPVGAVVLGSSVEVVGWHTLQKRAAQGGMRAVSVGEKGGLDHALTSV